MQISFFGALSMWPIMELYGRRMVLKIGSVLYVIAAIIMVSINHGIAGMCE